MMRARLLRTPWWLVLLAALSLGATGGDVRLAEAVRNGDTAAVTSLLTQDIDVNAPLPDGTTALHWAVHRDDLRTADLLIRAGADANAFNLYGATPLLLACTNASAPMIEKLLRADADPNASSTGEPPIMTAARTGSVDAVRVLVAYGASANAKEARSGQTTLMWAAAEDHARVVQVLLGLGANVNARSDGGFTPLLFAARQGALESARILVGAGANLNDAPPDNSTPLLAAMVNAHHDTAAFLLASGADPNIANTTGTTPLHVVVGTRNPNHFNGVARPDRTPTGDVDSLELARALLAHGANPNAQTRPYVDTSRALKRELSNADLTGATPFLLAAKLVDTTLVELLLAHGADPTLLTLNNTTALMVAAGIGFSDGSSPGSNSDALEAVTLLWRLGTNVNATNDDGQTALHGGAQRGADEVVRFLVGKGAKLDLQDIEGKTPLNVAEGFFQNSVIVRESTQAVLRELGAAVQK